MTTANDPGMESIPNSTSNTVTGSEFDLESRERRAKILAKHRERRQERAARIIVTKLKKSDAYDKSLNLMELVSLAQEPLSLDQLRHALASQQIISIHEVLNLQFPHDRSPDNLGYPASWLKYQSNLHYVGDDASLKERIATWSGGLVKVQDDDKCLVGFTQDPTITNFFLESGLRLLSSTSTEDPVELGHDSFVRICTHQLSVSEKQGMSLDGTAHAKIRTMPFLVYAVKYWPIHLRLAGQAGDAHQIAFQQFAEPQTHQFQHWTALFGELFPHEASFFAMGGSKLLHLAAALGLKIIIEKLIDTGTDLETPDYEGNRPIHYAARHGCDETIKQLLSAGAHVEIHNWSGKTPLVIAVENEHLAVVETLINYGADVDAQGKYMTALQAATSMGHDAITSYLRNHMESQNLRLKASEGEKSTNEKDKIHDIDDPSSIDDSNSVVSGDSVFSTTISDSSLSTPPRAANDIFEEFLNSLRSDTELQSLYTKAHAKFDVARFERNHERLLRSYFKSLRDNAADSKQNHQVVHMLGPRRWRMEISRRIYQIFETSDPVNPHEMDLLRRQSVERKVNPNRLLAEHFPETKQNYYETDRRNSSDKSDAESGEESKYESDAGNEVKTMRLNQVIDFLLVGQPFKEFKKGLQRFINSPSTIEEAAEAGDVRYFERFLENVPESQYIWLNRIREIGYTSSELAEFIIKDVNSYLKDLERVGILLEDGSKRPTGKLPIQDFMDRVLRQSELEVAQDESQVIESDTTMVSELDNVVEETLRKVPLLQPATRTNTMGESIIKLENEERFLVIWNCCCRRRFSAHVSGTNRKLAEEALRQVEWNESRDGPRILHPFRRGWVHNLAWNISIVDALINLLLNENPGSQPELMDLERGQNRGRAELSSVEQAQAEVTSNSLFRQNSENGNSQRENPNTMFVCLFNKKGGKWRLSHAKFPSIKISERQRSKAPENLISRDRHAELQMHDKDQNLFNTLRSKLLKKRRPWYKRLIYPTRWKAVQFWEFHLYHTKKLVHPELQNKLPYESQSIISVLTKDTSSTSVSEMTPLLSGKNKQPEQSAPLTSTSTGTIDFQTDLLNNICPSDEWTYERLDKERLVKYKVHLKGDYLLHLLQCPWEAHPNSPIWQGLPRKINRKLMTKADPKLGWGFRIEEEWDALTFTFIICPFVIVIFIIATVLAVTYHWPVATAVAISMGSVTVTSLLFTMLTNISKQQD